MRKNYVMQESVDKFLYYRTEKRKRNAKIYGILFISVFLFAFFIVKMGITMASGIASGVTFAWALMDIYESFIEKGLKVSVPKNLLEGTGVSKAYFFVKKKGKKFFSIEDEVYCAFIKEGELDSITEFKKDFFNLEYFSAPHGVIYWKKSTTVC